MHLTEWAQYLHAFAQMPSADDDGNLDVTDQGCGVVKAEKFVVKRCEIRGGGEETGQIEFIMGERRSSFSSESALERRRVNGVGENPESEFVRVRVAAVGESQTCVSQTKLRGKGLTAGWERSWYLHPVNDQKHRCNISLRESNVFRLLLQCLDQPTRIFLLFLPQSHELY